MATKKSTTKFEEVTEETAIVAAPVEDNAPIVKVEDIMSGTGPLLNTLNMAEFEGKVATVNALSAALSLKDYGDAVMDVCDCIIMPGIRKGRNGMPDTDCSNTYVIDTSGQAWFSQSDGIARSAKTIAMMFPDFGKSTTDGCLHVKVLENHLPNGNTIKTLVLDM